MNKSGFIFIYVLLLSFLILSIGTYVFNKGVILPPFVKVTGEEQKIRELALGVVQQCIAQLAMPKKERGEKTTEEKKEKSSEISRDFELFFPGINRWRDYVLREEVDGVDANISICFTCEEGKININHFFDFKEKRLKKEPLIDELSKFLETFQIKGFKEQLEQFFKKREKPLFDITELCTEEYFEKQFGNRIFYIPPKKGAEEKKEIYLTDLFTIYNSDSTLNPFFLSDSVTQLFELRRAIAQPIDERKKHAESLKAELKETFSWAADWKKILEPMYQKPVGRYEQFFKKNLKCNLFSAVCRVQIGQRVETIFVIFSRKERVQDDKIMYDVAIMRLYFV